MPIILRWLVRRVPWKRPALAQVRVNCSDCWASIALLTVQCSRNDHMSHVGTLQLKSVLPPSEMLFFASANFLLVATTTDIFKKFHSESLTKRCRVYEWLCRRVEVVCISKKCRTATAVSKQCHARQLEDQLGNQIKTNILTNIWLFLAELGLLWENLQYFQNQEELSFSNNMFSHHDDIIISQKLTFQMMASVSGNSLAASLLRTASSGEI